MDDKEVIRKVREEHAKLEEIKASLVSAVHRAAFHDVGGWLDDVRNCFEHFRAHLIHRIALAEIGGFLRFVLERRPTLSNQVEHLQAGHARMIELAGKTLSDLRQLDPADPESVNRAALTVKMALSEVKFYEEAEALLVTFVFTQETGGEGD